MLRKLVGMGVDFKGRANKTFLENIQSQNNNFTNIKYLKQKTFKEK